ncbi:MAG TPA: DUF3306 domain-containing protein [Pseudolabrys sp.]|jgi:hypothetical protein
MSEPEDFLDRWSRRKREAAEESAPVKAKDAAAAAPPPEAKDAAAEVPFDPASLPPIESITAESDIRAFLRPGVPPDLLRAALRRAWSADPQIRDFIGLVENGWDFNNPNAMPGFGPIAASDVAGLLARVIGAPPPAETAAPQQIAAAQDNSEQKALPASDSELTKQSSQDQPAPKPDVAALEKDFMRCSEDDVATQNNLDNQETFPPPRPRGHGGALPK